MHQEYEFHVREGQLRSGPPRHIALILPVCQGMAAPNPAVTDASPALGGLVSHPDQLR